MQALRLNMANKNTQVRAKHQDRELSVSHTQTDSPLLDVYSLERLHQIKPELVDFVIEQTKIEAESRRKADNKIINFTFIERIGALLLGALVGSGSIGGAIYAAILGFETLAGIIASVGLGSLAVAFLRRDSK